MNGPSPLPRKQLEKVRVRIGRRSLFVVAGLPGAGKSTLLRGIEVTAEVPVRVLDTDRIRAWLASMLPAGMPYTCYRPLAPLLQRLRLIAVVLFARGPVVMHHQATGAGTRTVLVALGALSGRACHLLWVDCTREEALRGQRQRGRVRLKGSFHRHACRAERIRASLLAGRVPRGWRSLTVIDRPSAANGLHLVVE